MAWKMWAASADRIHQRWPGKMRWLRDRAGWYKWWVENQLIKLIIKNSANLTFPNFCQIPVGHSISQCTLRLDIFSVSISTGSQEGVAIWGFLWEGKQLESWRIIVELSAPLHPFLASMIKLELAPTFKGCTVWCTVCVSPHVSPFVWELKFRYTVPGRYLRFTAS